MTDPLLKVHNLSVRLNPGLAQTTVVNQLCFELTKGQTLGIVGESGSGKTMTALALMRLLPPLARLDGEVWLQTATGSVDLAQVPTTQMRAYRGCQLAMIFQEPSTALDPLYTCAAQLVETLQILQSLSRPAAQQRARQLMQEVQLPERLLDRYPHQLSGGQLQRVAMALALCGDPSLLIADEPTTALDVTVQAEILKLLRQIQQHRQMSMIFITHDLGVIAEIADQVIVMHSGKIVESGLASHLFTDPSHPYTQGLLACRPCLDRRLRCLPTTQDFMTVRTKATGEVEILPKGIQTIGQAWVASEISGSETMARLQQLQQRPPLLEVRHLKTYYPVRQGVFGGQSDPIKAIDDVSFVIYPGETLGLVGESGCGKSTLGRTVLRLVKATSGEVIYDGDELLSLPAGRLQRVRRDLQYIFQDPYASLDPRQSVGETVIEPMNLHGIGFNRQERQRLAADLFVKVGLDPNCLHRMPHEFSGGQRQRICIARALACQPKLVICDEAVSALDVSVQAQVLNLLKQLQADLGLTYLFISHDLSVVKFMSDRIMVMQQGQIQEMAPTDQLYTDPQTDYTRQLIAAIPTGRIRSAL